MSLYRRLFAHSSLVTLLTILIIAISCFWFVNSVNIHRTNVRQTIIAGNLTPSIDTRSVPNISYLTPTLTLMPVVTPGGSPTPVTGLPTPATPPGGSPTPATPPGGLPTPATPPGGSPTPATPPGGLPMPATPPGGSPTPATSQGWKQIFAEDFNTPVPVGNFPGNVYGSKFTVYDDGSKDTAGQQGAPSRYYPSKVASVSNGLLNLYLHTENGTPMAAAILPVLPGNHLYGKYTIRFRSDALSGFKVAWLLWPDSENWPHDGEMDFPESGLDEPIGAFMHHQNGTSGSDQDAYTSTATYTSWHTTSIEWSPKEVNFILDDQSIGTSTARIPATSMHWVIQTKSCLPTCPAATTAGNLQIDWITAYSPA